MIPFILLILEPHDPVFLIGIPCPYRTAELFFQSPSHRLRHCLGDRNDRSDTAVAAVCAGFSDIVTQLTQSGGISDKTFHLFLLDRAEHFGQCLLIHAGAVHHDHVFLDQLKFTFSDIVYPHTDKSFLHTYVISCCRSQENTACCIMPDLVPVLDHAERSSRRTAGTHHPVVRCVFVCRRDKTVILLTKCIFIYHRKISKCDIFRIILVEISRSDCMCDQIPDPFVCLLDGTALFPGIADLVIIFPNLSALHLIQHPEAYPAKSFI